MDNDDQQTIYYFSEFALFDETIIQDLLFCKWLKQSVLTIMDHEWQQQAKQAIYLEKGQQKLYLPLSFFVDTCIYSWIITINYLGTDNISNRICQIQFQDNFRQKLYNFKYDQELFTQLTEQFIQAFLPRTIQIFTLYDKSSYSLKMEKLQTQQQCNQYLILNRNFKPLIAMKERIQKNNLDPVPLRKKTKVNSDIDQLIKGIDDIVLDDYEFTIVNNKRKKVSPNRSSTECGDKITNQLKFRKLQKQIEKNMIPQSKFQHWQIALHTVVQIWEFRGLQEKIRCLQPAEGFYRQILQLWVIEKCDSNISFEQFLFKSRHFFSGHWDEKYVVAIHMIYTCLEHQLINCQKSQDQLFSILVCSVQEYMEKIWEKDIIHKAKQMSTQ